MRYILILALGIISSIGQTKLHVILSADANSNIGKEASIDKSNMGKFFSGIAEYFDDSQFYSLSSAQLSKELIGTTLENMKVGVDDLVVFYYSGHGDRSEYKGSPWPKLTPHNKNIIEVRDVLLAINQKMPRQVLMLIDACNGGSTQSPFSDRAPASVFNEKNIDKLFKEFKGSVVVTSSEPGYYSYTLKDDYGSLFTYALLRVMNEQLGLKDTSWNTILSKTKEVVVGSDLENIQTPKYHLTNQKPKLKKTKQKVRRNK